MMSTGCNYGKLKTNLRLAINRLKLLEKKKTELAQKSRREIADYLANGKLERAKIRVEHIIREDYLVEAMELVEMYCDLLLARFGLIQQMKTLDEGLAESVSSLIWAAPRLQTDIAELKIISDQLAVKYGKPYAVAARENGLHSVNEKLVHKLNVQAPPKPLVEKYLIEIARSHNVPYEPDVEILAEEIADEATPNVPLIEFGNDSKPPDAGFVTGPIKDNLIYPEIQCPQPDLPKPFNYPNPTLTSKGAPPIPNVQPSGPYPGPSPNIGFNIDVPAPSYESVFGDKQTPQNTGAIPKPAAPQPNIPEFFPELPSVPNTMPDSGPPNEVDFDDLARRFEELKKRG
ncbi:IST1 homolog [Parasteatoda tepidariorum]|uniref:IST1 homolog n=1 Tax=Parasteatoda tepidariorum TaxID=114398 RepID=UPI00077F8C78|nr:IST1 homolog [Parasteatoda tepidariorum]XP_015917695.1 IST1 homolog [Parasteatoda tepidariorum]XP_015917696.1 IST1 homolog [Parasteatoda tepidariorum]